MKELNRLHDRLKDLHYDLTININATVGEKFEIIGRFIDNELEDSISEVESAIDRIEELEEELEDASKAAEEWEEKYNETL